MRLFHYCLVVMLIFSPAAYATDMPSLPGNTKDSGPNQVEVTADQSLEYYQDQRIYVARGNAKAVRGDMVIEADILTAHERQKSATQPSATPATHEGTKGSESGTGDIDQMTADGHVRITDPKERVIGDHVVYDLNQHMAVITGKNLKYETEKEIVTAKQSLEYWEDKKIAVARGDAIAIQGDRRVSSDVLTAEFRDAPDGQQQMTKMTCDGHVSIVTKTDVSRGDKAVDDVARNIAIITGHVRITRADGTQLSGDVGEMDFNTNQSRLMNDGTGRVRALLTSKATSHTSPPATKTAAAP